MTPAPIVGASDEDETESNTDKVFNSTGEDPPICKLPSCGESPMKVARRESNCVVVTVDEIDDAAIVMAVVGVDRVASVRSNNYDIPSSGVDHRHAPSHR